MLLPIAHFVNLPITYKVDDQTSKNLKLMNALDFSLLILVV